jgi:hypothetical protein
MIRAADWENYGYEDEILNKKAVCNDIYRADVCDYFALLVY